MLLRHRARGSIVLITIPTSIVNADVAWIYSIEYDTELDTIRFDFMAGGYAIAKPTVSSLRRMVTSLNIEAAERLLRVLPILKMEALLSEYSHVPCDEDKYIN